MKKHAFILLPALMLIFMLPINAQAEDDYVLPDMKNLSRLYWSLGRLKIENDEHIDNFLMINDCDSYRDFRANEFVWTDARRQGREYITGYKKKFPLRFEIMQPLRLKEYDFEKKGFTVNPGYVVEGTRRFEVHALDSEDLPCKAVSGNVSYISHYPEKLVMEFSRPFSFDFLPVEKDIAEKYLKTKTWTDSYGRNYIERDAYLVMKVRFFAASKDDDSLGSGGSRARLLAVLESIEVYGEQKKRTPLYMKNYRTRKSAPKKSPKETSGPN